MPLKYLGKILFPRYSPWQRDKQMRIIVGTCIAALFIAAAVVAAMYYENSKR
jgi:hypothetical protein